MKRLLSPALNPAGLTSLIAALYALGYGIWNVAHHRGAVDPQVIVAALAAVAALLTRQGVTSLKDPRDGAGRALSPVASILLTAEQFERLANREPAIVRMPAAATPELVADVARALAQQSARRQPDYVADVQTAPDAVTTMTGRPPSTDPRERSAQ